MNQSKKGSKDENPLRKPGENPFLHSSTGEPGDEEQAKDLANALLTVQGEPLSTEAKRLSSTAIPTQVNDIDAVLSQGETVIKDHAAVVKHAEKEGKGKNGCGGGCSLF